MCWCCQNIDRDDVKQFHQFVVMNIHQLSMGDMVHQFTEEVADADTQEGIMNHMQRHFLHPSVQVTHIMRNLIGLSEDLRKVIVGFDEEDGDENSPMIDIRSLQMYLKVVNELMQIYKSVDTKKMLFADSYT